MAIRKVIIKNFKRFNGTFEIEFKDGLNVLVGDNEVGKSTIMEAIHLALTGYYGGKYIKSELTQYLFNKDVIDNYIEKLREGGSIPPPEISIEVFFSQSFNSFFEGTVNSKKENAEGIVYKIEFNSECKEEYQRFVKSGSIHTLPIEYYRASCHSFSQQEVTSRSIPVKSAMIDSSNFRFQNGSDVYISRIIRDILEPDEIKMISLVHRKMREDFKNSHEIAPIIQRINGDGELSDSKISLAVDLGTQRTWESSLVTEIDDIPFAFAGKGAQCIMKTSLALKKSQNAQLILLEEPESHLSFSKLNILLRKLVKSTQQQIIVSTHSSFVANKLGLDNLILIKNNKTLSLDDLPKESAAYFKKLSGFDTLRFILCRKAILVEGPSDELVVQKAYLDRAGNLPIQDGIDVISVGTSFLRFLDVANTLHQNVAVVTDNDGDIDALRCKYKNYIGENARDNIRICYDENIAESIMEKHNNNTLEPALFRANDCDVKLFSSIVGGNRTENDLLRYMQNNKTEVALRIFESTVKLTYPQYILDAFSNE